MRKIIKAFLGASLGMACLTNAYGQADFIECLSTPSSPNKESSDLQLAGPYLGVSVMNFANAIAFDKQTNLPINLTEGALCSKNKGLSLQLQTGYHYIQADGLSGGAEFFWHYNPVKETEMHLSSVNYAAIQQLWTQKMQTGGGFYFKMGYAPAENALFYGLVGFAFDRWTFGINAEVETFVRGKDGNPGERVQGAVVDQELSAWIPSCIFGGGTSIAISADIHVTVQGYLKKTVGSLSLDEFNVGDTASDDGDALYTDVPDSADFTQEPYTITGGTATNTALVFSIGLNFHLKSRSE